MIKLNKKSVCSVIAALALMIIVSCSVITTNVVAKSNPTVETTSSAVFYNPNLK